MTKSRFTKQQIALALRQAEGGTPVREVCRKLGVNEQTFYRWRRRVAGMGVTEVRKLTQLEEENRKLKQLVADLSLDNAKRKVEAWRRHYNADRPHSALGSLAHEEFAASSGQASLLVDAQSLTFQLAQEWGQTHFRGRIELLLGNHLSFNPIGTRAVAFHANCKQ